MRNTWLKLRISKPVLRRMVMGLVLLPPLVALPRSGNEVDAKVAAISKKAPVKAAKKPVKEKRPSKKITPR